MTDETRSRTAIRLRETQERTVLEERTDNELSTNLIREEVLGCGDIDELREHVFPMMRTQKELWRRKIEDILAESDLTKAALAQKCGVSRMSVHKWCNGAIPRSREMFLRIGMAAGYDREKMDQLLQRYGRYPGLYPKSLEDCVCIFVLEQPREGDMLTEYDAILTRIRSKIIQEEREGTSEISTEEFDEKLSGVKDEDALEAFIQENSEIFATGYHRLYAYVMTFVMANYAPFGGTVYELALGQGWSSSLRQSVSAIRQKKWYPTRNKIISLGLHLSMDRDQIDRMLALAHMEPLCAKNLFESVILFILEDAALSNKLNRDAEMYDPDELCTYAREILEELGLPEMEDFLMELPEANDEW